MYSMYVCYSRPEQSLFNRINLVIFQQALPHLSSDDERAMVVMNKDGDYAIVKAKWKGFRCQVIPTSQRY